MDKYKYMWNLSFRAVNAQWSSLMNTEAGKIHGALWGFGGKEGYRHYMSKL